MSIEQNRELTPAQIVDYLRDNLRDSMATLQMTALRSSDTRGTIEDRLRRVLDDFYVEGGLKDALPERPEVEIIVIDPTKYLLEARPKNETAKRIIQMLNIQMPMVRGKL